MNYVHKFIDLFKREAKIKVTAVMAKMTILYTFTGFYLSIKNAAKTKPFTLPLTIGYGNTFIQTSSTYIVCYCVVSEGTVLYVWKSLMYKLT